MTAIDTTRPRPKPFWSDARFLIGVLLVVASIAGVWFVVSASRQTVPVLTAARTIVPGQPVAADDVRTIDVALGRAADAYLAPEALAEGVIATRTIESGELVPVSAVGDAERADTTSVVVRSTVDVPETVRTGSLVEVWAAPLIEHGRYDTPRILVADASVVAVTRDDGVIGGASAALELVVPRADVADVLAAMSDESALSIVPAAAASR
ncbi:SAF domain-containing protein [Microbacterium immunditiarum]|uniref:SAF domain-containing protein n=1 Tax=Microbacterium immunditiarum TaxID=337480 RepID=A0A7Y9GQT1_9MICO|nr:SAF domain-containing protein [Microbacterium immunditiarum]NYE20972.1 hypothetical protein [Microbacterium immunditiarum]